MGETWLLSLAPSVTQVVTISCMTIFKYSCISYSAKFYGMFKTSKADLKIFFFSFWQNSCCSWVNQWKWSNKQPWIDWPELKLIYCPTLANFPISAHSIFGGMIPEENVLICADQNCYTSGDGLSWNLTQNLDTSRHAVGITTAPFSYPPNSIFVTAGVATDGKLKFY